MGGFSDIFLFPEGIFKKEPDQRMKFRRTNKVGKFEVKKVKNKGAKMPFVSRFLHGPLKLVDFFACLSNSADCFRFFSPPTILRLFCSPSFSSRSIFLFFSSSSFFPLFVFFFSLC